MDEERRIFEYFVVVGLPDPPEELNPGAQECGYKNTAPQPPITDICVVFPSLGESIPENFICVETTPSGHQADLNHGSIRTPSCYLCYRRGYHKPPLVDIGVLYEGRGERVICDSHIVRTTPFGRQANVNNANQGIYLTYRRAAETAASNLLAVTDVCVILTNKGESPPHTFYKINKNLNKGMVGSDVFICYKKSMACCNRIAYKPAILDRFPAEDYSACPLPPNVPIFALPMGALIECWPAKCQAPQRQFLTFVLTDDRGHKLYGAAVLFYEVYPGELTAAQLEKLGVAAEPLPRTGSCSDNGSTNDPAEMMTFHVNKSICLVSRYPFFKSFRRFLTFWHRVSLTGDHPLPIERYISHLMYEVPFPTSHRPPVLAQIGNESICFDNPEDSPLPLNGASFMDFVKLLGAENSMYLMLLALMEQKILIHSLRPSYLTSVAEALCALLFPFHWQCPYIPQCPLDLAGVLHAPLPFIAGVDSRYFELYEDPPKDVTCVDLDTNTISQSEIRQKVKLSLLPRKAAKLLRQQIEALEAKVAQADFHIANARSQKGFLPVDIDLQNVKRCRNLELEIQETFLRFMVQILKGYQHYLKPIRTAPSVGATDLESLFDVNGFLRSRDKSGLEFYKCLSNTQLFIRFIEERSLLSDKDKNAYLAFFDECMGKADTAGDHPDNVRLLEYEYGVQPEHAVVFAPPEPISPEVTYSYGGIFPKLNPELFGLDGLLSEPGKLLRAPKQWPSHDAASAARRTKQEVKAAQKLAAEQLSSPVRWAKCLLSYYYSLWFLHLPAYAKVSVSKQRTLRDAYSVLDRMQSARLSVLDEVCYRILIQVCGSLAQPVMAVKVFLDMKRQGIQPNAITYGFYNRAVLEAEWPSGTTLTAQKYWTKIRLSVRAIALFKWAIRERRIRTRRTLSQYSAESADCVSQGSLSSQSKKLAGDMASMSTVISGDQAAGREEDRAALIDQGYQSQVTEDSLSTGIDSVQHATESNGRTRCIRLTEHELSAFDELYAKGRAIVSRPLFRSDLSSYDSMAGLLMSSDLSKLDDDSVFLNDLATRSKVTKRLRNRSLMENLGQPVPERHPPKMAHSLSEPEHVEIRSPISPANLNQPLYEKKSIDESQSFVDQEKEENENTDFDPSSERKPTKLGNIPEEVHVEAEDIGTDYPLHRSHSGSPTKSVRTTITDKSDPLGFLIDQQNEETPTTPVPMSPMINMQTLTEKMPFEDELREEEMQSTPIETTPPSGANSFLGFGNIGRTSVRSFWNRLNSATPTSKLSKSQTMDANFPVSGSNPFASYSEASPDPFGECSADSSQFRTPMSPTLTHLMAQGAAKVMSKVDALQKSSDGFARLRSGVSHVIRSFKGNIEQQLGSPIRGSWSSLSLGDSSGLGYASTIAFPGVDGRSGDDISSLKDEEHGGLWFHHVDDSASTVTGASAEFSADDPAFQLSSGETGRLSGFDFGSFAKHDQDAPTVEILLCTTSRCNHCSSILYDEEIMAGWSVDASELNTRCQFCGEKLVPLLTVVVRPQRSTNADSWYVRPSSLSRDRSWNGKYLDISRNESFNRTVCKSEEATGNGKDRSESITMEKLPVDSPVAPGENCSSVDETTYHESTPKASPMPRRIGSESDRSLFKESINRRLFMDTERKPIVDQVSSAGNVDTPTLSVPFLSPFVLRKEIENLLASEGDDVLATASFLQKHGILYWNLVYAFQRLSTPTYLTSWLIDEYYETCFSGEVRSDNAQLVVRCVYDFAFWHDDEAGRHSGRPLYLSAMKQQYGASCSSNQDQQNSPLMQALLIEHRSLVSKSLIAQMIGYLSVPNLHKPILILINEHRKRSGPGGMRDLPKHFSIYRDILFLALAHFGRKVKRDDFDREYALALAKLPPTIAARLPSYDRSAPLTAKTCRKILMPLDLC